MRIDYDKRGLQFQHGKLIRILEPGFHFFLNSKDVEIVDVSKEILSDKDLSVFFQLPEFSSLIEEINLADQNIALLYEDGVFSTLLGPGRHFFWKGFKKRTYRIVDLNSYEIDPDIDRKVLANSLVSPYVISFSIDSFENGLLFIEKQFNRMLDPGNYFFWRGNKSINVLKVDLRQQQIEVSGQEIMTKDKVGLRLSFLCQYKIIDPKKVLLESNDFEKQLLNRPGFAGD